MGPRPYFSIAKNIMPYMKEKNIYSIIRNNNWEGMKGR